MLEPGVGRSPNVGDIGQEWNFGLFGLVVEQGEAEVSGMVVPKQLHVSVQ